MTRMGVAQGRLVGWKAIAAHFSRDERTVMRWAAERGMPVQRVAGQARASVYASPDELDAWLNAAAPVAQPASAPTAAQPNAAAASAQPVVTEPQSELHQRRWLLALLTAPAILGLAWIALLLLRPNAAPAAAQTRFHDAQAQAAYLQATYDWNLRTRDSLNRAVHEYGEAIGRDPGVAAPYVGLANTYLLLREYGALPEPEAYARATAAARLAITLDPNSMEAHRALAFIAFWSSGDVPTARREFERALALAPRDALTHHWLATALSANGERQAALREVSVARQLDPTATSVIVHYALLSYLAGHKAEAERTLASLLPVDGQDAGLHRVLSIVALGSRRYDDFLREEQEGARLRGDNPARVTKLAAAYRRGGAAAMFHAMEDDARAETRRGGAGYYRLAVAAALAGDTATARDALQTACARHEREAVSAPGDKTLQDALPPGTLAHACGPQALLEPYGLPS